MDFTPGQIILILIWTAITFWIAHGMGRADQQVEDAAPEIEHEG